VAGQLDAEVPAELLDGGLAHRVGDGTGLHVGYVDTDLTAGVDAPKSRASDVAALALDGIEAGAHEVLADDISRQVKAGLAEDLGVLYPQLANSGRRV
jgi:hypothetical protein